MVSVRATLGAALAAGFVSATCLTGFAEPDAAALKASFASRLAGIQTWQAQLEQTLEMPDLRPVAGSARIFYQKPDKLKMNFSDPPGQWLLFYQTAAWYQKSGAPRQAVDLPATGGPVAMYQFLPRLLNGQLEELAQGYLESASVNKGILEFTLSALDPAQEPSRILCQVDTESMNLRSVQIAFSGHQAVLRLTFSGIEIDASLPENAFTMPAKAPDPGTKKRP